MLQFDAACFESRKSMKGTNAKKVLKISLARVCKQWLEKLSYSLWKIDKNQLHHFDFLIAQLEQNEKFVRISGMLKAIA